MKIIIPILGFISSVICFIATTRMDVATQYHTAYTVVGIISCIVFMVASGIMLDIFNE